MSSEGVMLTERRDTAFDTQLAGCVTTCAEKNYEVDGTCVACESCA